MSAALDPNDFRGLRGRVPSHGKAKMFSVGCRCDECVAGDTERRAEAVQRSMRWAQENPARAREIQAGVRERSREKRRIDALAYYHKRMAEDPEAVRANRRAWAKTPKGQLANRLGAHRRRGVTPDAEAREWAEIILNDPCAYCGARPVELDHIDPISLGGDGTWENLTPGCRSCNASKNDTPLLVHLARSAA